MSVDRYCLKNHSGNFLNIESGPMFGQRWVTVYTVVPAQFTVTEFIVYAKATNHASLIAFFIRLCLPFLRRYVIKLWNVGASCSTRHSAGTKQPLGSEVREHSGHTVPTEYKDNHLCDSHLPPMKVCCWSWFTGSDSHPVTGLRMVHVTGNVELTEVCSCPTKFMFYTWPDPSDLSTVGHYDRLGLMKMHMLCTKKKQYQEINVPSRVSLQDQSSILSFCHYICTTITSGKNSNLSD